MAEFINSFRRKRGRKFSAAPAGTRNCSFFCEKKEAQRSGKGTALVPFQTPTKFRCRKRCGTTALVNPPAGNLCAAVQLACSRRAQGILLRGHQFTRRRLQPPLSFAHSGVPRSKPRGSGACGSLPEGAVCVSRLREFPATPARTGGCPFFCEKKEAQRSSKGTALVHLVRYGEAGLWIFC